MEQEEKIVITDFDERKLEMLKSDWEKIKDQKLKIEEVEEIFKGRCQRLYGRTQYQQN